MKTKILDLVQTFAIIAGIIYGAVELRNFREARDREVMIELLHTFQNADFTRATSRVRSLPDTISGPGTIAALGDDLWMASLVANTYEGLGVMVSNREIPIGFIEQFQGGGARIAWRNLRPFIDNIRTTYNRPAAFEYFQWLIETLDRQYPASRRVPAYVELKGWKP